MDHTDPTAKKHRKRFGSCHMWMICLHFVFKFDLISQAGELLLTVPFYLMMPVSQERTWDSYWVEAVDGEKNCCPKI